MFIQTQPAVCVRLNTTNFGIPSVRCIHHIGIEYSTSGVKFKHLGSYISPCFTLLQLCFWAPTKPSAVTTTTSAATASEAAQHGEQWSQCRRRRLRREWQQRQQQQHQPRAQFVYHFFLSDHHVPGVPSTTHPHEHQRDADDPSKTTLSRGVRPPLYRARLGQHRAVAREDPTRLQLFHQLCLLLSGRQDISPTHVPCSVLVVLTLPPGGRCRSWPHHHGRNRRDNSPRHRNYEQSETLLQALQLWPPHSHRGREQSAEKPNLPAERQKWCISRWHRGWRDKATEEEREHQREDGSESGCRRQWHQDVGGHCGSLHGELGRLLWHQHLSRHPRWGRGHLGYRCSRRRPPVVAFLVVTVVQVLLLVMLVRGGQAREQLLLLVVEGLVWRRGRFEATKETWKFTSSIRYLAGGHQMATHARVTHSSTVAHATAKTIQAVFFVTHWVIHRGLSTSVCVILSASK